MKTSGEDIFGPHHLSFICTVPSAGLYKVGIRAVLGPDQGILRMFQRDVPVGESADLYAETQGLSAVLSLGQQEMAAGDNLLFLHLTGKNPRSSGMGLDLAEIVLQRIP
jgi:hypothetical protein